MARPGADRRRARASSSGTWRCWPISGFGDLAVAAVAKGPDRDAGREHFYLPGKPSFMLEPRDPVLYYIQRLRDEAHRFAIGSHRARRAKAMGANPLDEIAGIGPRRKKALLQRLRLGQGGGAGERCRPRRRSRASAARWRRRSTTISMRARE